MGRAHQVAGSAAEGCSASGMWLTSMYFIAGGNCEPLPALFAKHHLQQLVIVNCCTIIEDGWFGPAAAAHTWEAKCHAAS